MKSEGKIEQPQPAETANLAALELKANLNPEQKDYLEKLKAKRDKILQGKTTAQLAKAGDLETLKEYNAVLDEILEFLRTKEMKESELEKELNLREQYEEQVKVLKETGVLEEFSDGQWGIKDILGKKRPIPSYDEIKARLNAQAEMLEKKREQGFTQLLLVPIGMKLEDLIALAGKLILKKHKEGKLLGTDGQKLELDEDLPVYIEGIYKDADVTGDLVYYPKKFDKENHGGKTKEELILEIGGWQIELIEDLPDLPEENKGKIIGGRKQLEANQSPVQYLEKIQTDPQYAHEQLNTPEAQLSYFMQYLQRKNQVIDDWQGKGKGCWNAGAYFKGAGLVPRARWVRDDKRVYLRGYNPDLHSDNRAARSSVII